MEPFIHDGEAVTVCRADTYHPGDVVLATVDGGLVLHYIATACGDRFTLMGAANLQKTETCRRHDILALLISPRIPRRRLLLWHRLLPIRRLLLPLFRKLKTLW